MKRNIYRLLIFVLFSLTGCSSLRLTALPVPTIITPMQQTLYPTATKYPTKTSTPCPPYLDTKLPELDFPESYIGKIFRPPYPEELEIRFDGFIGELDLSYGFMHVINQNTSQNMFWLEHLICRSTEGKAFFKIIGILFPSINLERQEVVYPGSCQLNAVLDPEILAVGDRLPYSEKLNNITQAWRANRQTEKIEEISINGIECLRESGIRVP